MSRSLRPRPVRPDFTVLLSADPPPPHRRAGAESPAGRHEALVGLARAVFAEGGRIAVPVDVDITLSVGTVALEYAEPQVAERRRESPPPRLAVMETERTDDSARALLTPLVVRGAVAYLGADGAEVGLDLRNVEVDQPGLDEARRQRVTFRMIAVVRPTVAVLLSPARHEWSDLAVLRQSGVRTVVFRNTILDADAPAELFASDVEDPTDRLLQDIPPRPEARLRPLQPYAYLMQRLVAEWTGRHR